MTFGTEGRALQTEYIRALENTRTTGIALQGFLLTDGLEAPAHPGEIDRAIRETNVPMPEPSAFPRTGMLLPKTCPSGQILVRHSSTAGALTHWNLPQYCRKWRGCVSLAGAGQPLVTLHLAAPYRSLTQPPPATAAQPTAAARCY